MAAAVLSNIAADRMVAGWMINDGVLEVILTVSTAFPELIDLQKSCIGTLGNIANRFRLKSPFNSSSFSADSKSLSSMSS